MERRSQRPAFERLRVASAVATMVLTPASPVMSKTLFGPRPSTTFLFPGSVGLNKVIFMLAWAVLFSGVTTQSACASTATTTTLAVTSTGNAVTTVSTGSVVTLTATVNAGGSAVNPGEVKFCDAAATYCSDIHLLGKAQLTGAGAATFRFVPGVGSHSYKAVFVGTTSYGTSTSSASSLTVTGSATGSSGAVTIAQSGSAGNYSLTATVTGNGTTRPTGSVSFLDTDNANYVLATATLGITASGLNFVNSSTPVSGDGTDGVAVGDFNGDGISDLAVTNQTDNSVTILLGQGNGKFQFASNLRVGNDPGYIVVGDFNSDGKQDLAFTDFTGDTVEVWLGHGDGTFTSTSSYPTGNAPLGVVAEDLNGDGIPDLAVVNGFGGLTVLLGKGDGTFTPAASPATGVRPRDIVAADFNGDGIPDFAVGNSGDNTISILLGRGDGTFTAAASPPTGTEPSGLVTGDFNGDGKPDVVSVNLYGNNATLLLGKGDGTFTAGPIPATGASPYGVTVGDFNGDGKADLAVTNFLGTYNVTVLLGDGAGNFAPLPPLTTILDPEYVVAGDFNGDGLSDFVVVDGSTTVPVYLASGTSVTATVSHISPVGTGTHLVDASYAGDPVYTGGISGTTALTAEPEPTASVLSANPAGSASGQQVTLTATLAPDTAQNHNATGTVTFYSGSTSLGTGTAIANGVASVNVTSLPVGSDCLTATYTGDTNFATSTSNPLCYTV